jgi:flagellar hook-basal body complex protein FliE
MSIPGIGVGSGAEWQISLGDSAPQGTSGSGFSSVLSKQLGNLEQLQTEAADGARALASGTASDPSEVVVAVERARLAMQLASQLRTKSVEAISDLMHTQV